MTKQDKVAKVMHEWKNGRLTSNGKKVTDYDQAIAIALSEAGLSKYAEGGGIDEIEVPLRADIDGDIYEVIGVNHKLNKVKAKDFSSGDVIEMPIDKWIIESFVLGTQAKFNANGREYVGTVVMKNGQKSISLYKDENYSGDAERVIPFREINIETLKPTMEKEKFSKGGNVIERRYVNKDEDYEVRYAKDKPIRKGYNDERMFAVGGEITEKGWKNINDTLWEKGEIMVIDESKFGGEKVFSVENNLTQDVREFEDKKEAYKYAIEKSSMPSGTKLLYLYKLGYKKEAYEIRKASENSENSTFESFKRVMDKVVDSKNEIYSRNKFAVGGEIGNTVSFKGDYGTPRSGVVKEKRGSSYIVATDDGDRLVDSYEVISFSETPVAKKKRFGFFEGGGSIEEYKQAEKDYDKYGEYLEDAIEDGNEADIKKYTKLMDEAETKMHRYERKYENGGGVGFKERSERDSIKLAKAYQKLFDSNFEDKEYNNYEKIVKETQIPKEELQKIEYYISTTPKGQQRMIDIYRYWGVKYEGGGEIQSKIDKLQAVVNSKMMPEIRKEKARKQIAELEKELHESKETKAEEKEEHEEGGSEYKSKLEKDLEKELHRLQKDLFSDRLLKFREGDDSEEAKELEKERQSKLNRFTEIIELLNKGYESPNKEENPIYQELYAKAKAEEKAEDKKGGSEYGYVVWEDGTHRIISKHPTLSGAEKYAKELANKNKSEIYHFGSIEKYERFKAEEGKSEYESRLDEKEKLNATIQKLYAIEGKAEDLINYQSGGIQGQSVDKIKKYVEYVNKEVSKLDVPFGSEVFEVLEDENAHSLNLTLGLLGFYKNEKDSGSWAKSQETYTKLVDVVNEVKGGKEAKATTKKPTTRKAPIKKAVAKTEPKPKFKVGDIVGTDKDDVLAKKITSFKTNRKGEVIYSGYYISKPSEKFNFEESELVSIKTPAKPKADHKKLVAKLKAKKGAKEYSNKASLVPFTDKRRKRNEASDRKREALPLGKRVSADGNVYWENRLNRGDLDKGDKFEKGGEVKGSGWGLNLNW